VHLLHALAARIQVSLLDSMSVAVVIAIVRHHRVDCPQLQWKWMILLKRDFLQG
jgi:hypothetical protein